MTSLLQPFTCPHCHLTADPSDNFCRHCGRSLQPRYGFFYSHSGIILLAFLLGPLALPIVWMSKRISLVSKLIYSLLLVAMGICLIKMFLGIYQLVFAATQGLLMPVF